MKRCLISILAFLLSFCAWTQELRQFSIADTLKLDSLSIRESSFQLFINNQVINPNFYTLDWKKATLYLKTDTFHKSYPNATSLQAKFSTWPIDFSKTYQLRPIQKSTPNTPNPYIVEIADLADEPFFQTDGLEKSGNISRGITLGNTQSLAMQSAMNIQLSGQIADNVTIRAAISDENVPLQPEGTTQRIADYDRVFIELGIGKQKIIAGDFILNKPDAYFMNFFKKGQGLQIQTYIPNTSIFSKNAPAGHMQVQASGAIARGKFAQNSFNGIEGNQGPYRLTGANGENFIVVLSGTERVFIDGKQLVRGRENDYIIDYNTAEITFTARQLITKDRRIVVEFEYSERNYGRVMYHINHEWTIGKFQSRINFFTEQDLKNQSLQQNLTPAQIQLLQQIGDQSQLAIAPAVTLVDFNPNEILYKAIDSIISGDSIRIYKYSTHPDSARYRVFFSQVTQGNGDYEMIQNSANGKVYRFVGAGNGNFIAAVKLVPPTTQRMLTWGMTWKAHKNFKIETELAYSNFDQNSFSKIDNKDDNGYAYKVQFIYHKNIPNPKNLPRSIKWNLSYEQVEKTFQPIVRWRNVEFARDINTKLIDVQGNEFIPSFNLEYNGSANSKLIFQIYAFIKGNNYKVLKNELSYRLNKNNWNIDTWASSLFSGGLIQTQFHRQKSTINKQIGQHIKIGLVGETEYNLLRKDSIETASYMFNDWEIYIGSPDAHKWKWKVYYRPRLDHRFLNQDLRFAALGQNLGLELASQINKFQNVSLLFNYRDFKKKNDQIILESDNTQSATARIEYNAQILKQSIQINTFYELGSGLENKRDYSFIQVNNGQGTHYWDLQLDFNGNGVPDLDEFQEAQFVGQGNYIKVLVPSLEYVKTYNTQFNQNLFFKFPSSFKRGKTWQKILYKFSNQTVYRISKKTQNPALDKVINPFAASFSDTTLQYLNYSFRNTFYFNRNEGKWGLDIEYRDIRGKSLLTNGVDSRQDEAWQIRNRLNITRAITWLLKADKGNKRYNSEFLRNRNYSVAYYQAENKFTYQKETKWRVSASYLFQYKENKAQIYSDFGGEIARVHNTGIEAHMNFLKQGMLSGKFNVVMIDFNGALNTNLSYEMLNGLATGLNATWNLNIQQNIGKNLQASFLYEGRAGKNIFPGHFGSMQLRAYF